MRKDGHIPRTVFLFIFLVCTPNLLLAQSVESNGANQSKALRERYKALEKLDDQILHHGAESAEWKKLREIRDYFASQKDSGAQFLIGKLHEMNDDERRFLHGSDDFMQGIKYMMQPGKALAFSLKVDICNILGDSYPGLSPKVQQETLRAIADSYTPSTYNPHAGLGYIEMGLDRAGPASLPYLYELSRRDSDLVRCFTMDSLNTTGADMVKDSRDKDSITPAPKLDCHATKADSENAIQSWARWWDNNSSKLTFPKLPSLFDFDPADYEKKYGKGQAGWQP
jgi:hypothetical protein